MSVDDHVLHLELFSLACVADPEENRPEPERELETQA